MATQIQEGNLCFNFEFNAVLFDKTQYYQKHFQGIKPYLKAVDILAVHAETGYLIES